MGINYGRGRTYDELQVGERHRFRLPTITEAYINNFCCLTADFNPLHVDIELAKKTIHGERIAPGTLTTALTFNTFAMLVYGTGMALLELNFKLPNSVKINDTLEVEIEILEKKPSATYAQGGLVRQRMTTTNQHGKVVADGTALLLISKEPLYPK
ncbi:MAG TPA: MaoC/PaaZ C-terminal domain-containing protein [Hyphomicrobiaceae bacterium]|nr:MaoC/PaaZ C-terminal domain-containing protein [Hyphomicrobiaceae bacterium]